MNDWLGPITAYLEVWERHGEEYRPRGQRVVSAHTQASMSFCSRT